MWNPQQLDRPNRKIIYAPRNLSIQLTFHKGIGAVSVETAVFMQFYNNDFLNNLHCIYDAIWNCINYVMRSDWK